MEVVRPGDLRRDLQVPGIAGETGGAAALVHIQRAVLDHDRAGAVGGGVGADEIGGRAPGRQGVATKIEGVGDGAGGGTRIKIQIVGGDIRAQGDRAAGGTKIGTVGCGIVPSGRAAACRRIIPVGGRGVPRAVAAVGVGRGIRPIPVQNHRRGGRTHYQKQNDKNRADYREPERTKTA